MKGRGLGVLLIPFVAALAVYLPFSGGLPVPLPSAKPRSPAPVLSSMKSKQAASKTATSGAARNAEQMLDEFFGNASRDARCSYKIDFLIATVPDPVDSHLDYSFDRYVDAIERAIQVAGYVPDRYYLPWLERETGGDGSVGQTRSFETDPGVILFRGRPPDRLASDPLRRQGKLLILLLVGELPTSGVQKAAMWNALETAAGLSHWRVRDSDCPPTTEEWREVRIIGPSFSGSETSLQLILPEWLGTFRNKGTPRVQMVSGSATAVSDEFVSGMKDEGVDFSATIIPDNVALKSFVNYLIQIEGKPDRLRIAMLTENTSYGRSLQKANVATGQESKPVDILSLPFPLHISAFRAAAEDEAARMAAATQIAGNRRQAMPISMRESGAKKDSVPSTSELEKPSVELILSNLLNTIDRERISYVGLTGTNVQDRLFLAKQIRKHCPNVVLFTFDSDILYLHSDVNVDLQGMLVVTPYPLFGRNQVWTYPFGYDSRFQFPAHTVEGVYNASLALLSQDDQALEKRMLEYSKPFCLAQDKPALWLTAVGRDGFWPVKLLPYSDEKDYVLRLAAADDEESCPLDHHKSEPPSAGRAIAHAAAALKMLGRDDLEEGAINVTAASNAEVSIVAFVLLTLLCVIPLLDVCFRVWQNLKRRWPPNKLAFATTPHRRGVEAPLLRLFGGEVSEELRGEARLYQLAWAIGLFTMFVLLVSVFLLPWWIEGELPPRIVRLDQQRFMLVAVLSFLLLSLLVAGFRLYQLLRGAYESVRRGGMTLRTRLSSSMLPLSLVLGLGFGLVLLLRYAAHLFQEPNEALFLYARAVELGSGLSPLLPLLFVGTAGLLWVVCCLRRVWLTDGMKCTTQHNGRVGFLNLGAVSLGAARTLEDCVTGLINRASFRVAGSWIVIAVAGFAFYRLFFVRSIRSIEGREFDSLFAAAFIVVYFALSLTFLRFIRIWQALRSFLRQLAWHPMAAAYKRLKENNPDIVRPDLANHPPTFTALTFSVEHAKALARLAAQTSNNGLVSGVLPTPPGLDVASEAKQAEAALCEALAAEANHDWPGSFKLRGEARGWLAQISHKVANYLEQHWCPRPAASPALSGVSPKARELAALGDWPEDSDDVVSPHVEPSEEETKLIRLGEEFLAGRVAAFIHHIFAHLQNLVGFVTAGLLLMLMAIMCYPFQPRNLLLLFNWSIILTVVAATIVVFVQMERDKVLSAISGNTGQLTWNREFVTRIVVHVLLPIVALFGAQFPEAIKGVLSWVGLVQGGGANL